MTPDTADPAIRAVCPASVDPPSELVGPSEPTTAGRLLRRRARLPADLRSLDPARVLAVRDSWRALWSSRLLVWAAGTGTVLAFGFGPVRKAFDPPGVTRGFGWLGNLLAAPAARWDAAWYLVIAHYGYRPDLGAYTSSRTAFFPLYPLGLSAISDLGVPPVLAGVLLSLLALALALYGIHRLTTLELARVGRSPIARPRGEEVARLAVMVTAFAPMAFYFSAVYSESLYLALSVGVFWCARQGRWAWVGVLGALAAGTRSAGVVLMLPAVMLYLYGPREDRAPDFQPKQLPYTPDGVLPHTPDGVLPHTPDGVLPHTPDGVRSPDPPRASFQLHAVSRLRMAGVGGRRYKLRRDFLWLGLVPAGLGLYMAYLALSGGDAVMPFHAQDVWGRHFAGPYLGVWDGAKAAFEGARQLLSLQHRHVYFPAAPGSPFVSAGHNLLLFAFLLAAVPALVGVLRMLPLAYGVYVLVALALPLSYPMTSQPLMSLPRFLVVLFPLSIWLAAWLAVHPRARTPGLVLSALLMALFLAQFATWHWVA
jgi:Mannosyltransferase (PIG-V)